ncbi:hypothetical protein M1L60_37260 [Actinoplanes sp. TRM 88003]|uniref:Uncharacterized protein n=1 Tax=Paractinoplanes aksuensis TaxID=2939490 RepID=A0ABT1DZC6_9ACTN|nr:hypothetical protein [Actinoplanes aksuensis]MCO8276243.1 hypothetical protein [Actinoplanes aksuensis]
MTIAKSLIVTALQKRDQHARAEWVQRELPDRIDPARHAGLLATLKLDVDDLVAADTDS